MTSNAGSPDENLDYFPDGVMGSPDAQYILEAIDAAVSASMACLIKMV